MANFYTNDGGATWYNDSEYNNVVSIATITSGDYIVGSNLTTYGWAAGLNLDGVNFTLTQGQVYIRGVSSVSGIILPSNIDGWLFEDLGDLSESVDFSNVTSMSGTFFLYSNLRNVDFSNVTNIEAANFNSAVLTGASLPSSFSGFLGNSSYGTYFTNGVAETTGLADNGDGIWNGQLYVNAVLNATYTGWLYGTSTFYVNGQATPLSQYGHGQWNGGTYVSGVIVNPASGLQAFYKLSDLTDSSGNGKTLTNNGNVTFASGKIGNAAIMNDASKVLSKDQFQIGNNFAISLWAKQLTNDSQAALIGQYPGLWMSITTDGGIQLSDLASYGNDYVTGLISVGQWNHYVLNVVDGYAKVYLNNTLVIEQNNNQMTLWSDAGRGFGIGGEPLNNSGTKEMDAVGVWSRALNEAEVAALYNSGAGLELEGAGSVNLTTSLQAFYKLSDLTDSSGNGKTLTNNGNVTFASGKIGNAAIMNDASKVLSKDQFQIGNNFAISLWAKQLTNDSQAALIGQYPGLWMSITTDGGIQLSDLASYGNDYVTGLISVGQWNHYVLNVVDGYAKVYLNNTLVIEQNNNQMTLWSDAGRGFGIGGEPLNNSGTKEMDAVGVWSRALNEAEVAALYNSGAGLELGSEGNNYNSYFSIAKIQGRSIFIGNVKFMDPMGYNS